jgi:uncharacterized protein with HEPN domain
VIEKLLSDIREAIQRITTYIADSDYETFADDTRTQDAVIRNLEILGEASKKLSQQFRDTYQEVPWKSMAGVRDRLIHEYFGVNLDIVWQIANMELPKNHGPTLQYRPVNSTLRTRQSELKQSLFR